MEIIVAAKALAALAQTTRLSLFRLLVEAGEGGLPAGQIAKTLAVPNATLSFHVKELVNAGLVTARQESRFIYYAVNFTTMHALMAFLTENCCNGQTCPPFTGCGATVNPQDTPNKPTEKIYETAN